MLPYRPRILVLMGVAGAGKTTIGRMLAAELRWNYFEADDFHPPANIGKMSRGIPLTDEDRAPWLTAIRARIDACTADDQPGVFTCSGLKEKYRRILLEGVPQSALVYLALNEAAALERLNQRQGHYMKAGMIQSQFQILELPAHALTVDALLPPPAIVEKIRGELGL